MGLHHHYYADDLYYSPTPLLFANPSNAAVCVCRDADRDAEADRQDSEGAIPAAARVAAPTPRAAAQSGPTRHEARKEVVSFWPAVGSNIAPTNRASGLPKGVRGYRGANIRSGRSGGGNARAVSRRMRRL